MNMKETRTYVIVERREMLYRSLRVRRDRQGTVYVSDFSFSTCAGKSEIETQSAVKNLLDKIHYRGEDIYILLPHEQISTRYIQFPSVETRELESLITNRMPVLFPLSDDEVSWGYESVCRDRKGSSYVFLNVARRAYVDAATNAVRAAGGQVRGVYFLFSAYARVVDWTAVAAPEEYAAVFVGGRYAEIGVMRRGKTAVIRRALFERSDRGVLARELMKTLGRYTAFDGHGPVTKVYVIGEKDDVAEAAAMLSESTVYEIETLDVGPYVARYSTDAQRFSCNMAPMLAFAEAMPAETLSFLPKEIKEKNDLRITLRRYLLAGMLLVAAAGISLAGAWTDVFFKASRAHAAERLYGKDKDRYLKLISMQTYLDARAQGTAGIVTVLDAYYLLHVSAAPGIVLDRFSFDASGVSRFIATGSAETGEQVFAYVEKIKQSGMFSSNAVKLNYYRDASVGGKKRVAFEVALQ